MKLVIGNRGKLVVRKELFQFAFGRALNILFLSDFHFNKSSGKVVNQLLEHVAKLKIDMVLLGGDYVDSTKGLSHLETLLKGLTAQAKVAAIAGNHDYFFGIEKIEQLMRQTNVDWIEKTAMIMDFFGKKVKIDGNQLTPKNDVDLSILCMHKPIQFDTERYAYDLAFAGHLHGSQVVFWETERGLYPGKLFYKWNKNRVMLGSCLYLISKGLGDTIPIRYNCSKELILVNIV